MVDQDGRDKKGTKQDRTGTMPEDQTALNWTGEDGRYGKKGTNATERKGTRRNRTGRDEKI